MRAPGFGRAPLNARLIPVGSTRDTLVGQAEAPDSTSPNRSHVFPVQRMS
jgi:hypothetical protein